MHVVATAGHVDHGKSTLVRALTGMEPDRWAEERRRGMTIDLGFAWTSLDGEVLGFVDVPGHQRFLGNMLAGLGPVPAVLFVVAADEGWGRQSAEHLAAIDGLGLRNGLLAVTRCDLADPLVATQQALAEIRDSSLGDVPAVAVSGTTGAGLDDLRRELACLTRRLPAPVTDGPVRLWVDRAFTVKGAGTVVTGTLAGGALAVGDAVQVKGRDVAVRGLQSLGEPCASVTAVARVAVNLRGVERDEVGRGDVLLTGRWRTTDCVDVRLHAPRVPRAAVLHVGTAAVSVSVRVLGPSVARLKLPVELPLRAGDRALLREPASQRMLGGLVVLDADPPALSRRGAATARAAELAGLADDPVLRQVGEWVVDDVSWLRWVDGLVQALADQERGQPLQPWLSEAAASRALRLPADLVPAVARAAGLVQRGGRLSRPGALPELGPAEQAVVRCEQRLGADPFDAPTTREVGLSAKELAAAQSLGRLLVLGDVVVLPSAVDVATARLTGCLAPFSVADARQALGTRRPVAVALLEHLDQIGVTRRLAGGVRQLVSAPGRGARSST